MISIITINYNNAHGLQLTMDSIVQQTTRMFEYIVVDGGSKDGSVELIEEYKSYMHYWVSEKDSGIYNAMNKGIRMSTGDYLLFLNSGDWLANDKVIEQVLPYLNNEYEILSGELELLKKDTDVVKLYPPSEINMNYCILAGLTHPNTFIKRELFDKYGYYNENNKIISDWEFFLIVCGLNKCKYKALPFQISCFDMNGISSQNKELVKKETQEALKRLLPWWKKTELYIKRKCKPQ
jgi:glycosyltransferase involved in cell wall biosynthesis